MAVHATDTAATFTVKVDVGPADIETTLLDEAGRPLCGAFYATVRKWRESDKESNDNRKNSTTESTP
jgi:hypothetical protein